MGVQYPKMAHVRLKISDVVAITGFTRFQLRGFLRDVFPVERKGAGKRTFSPQELLVIAVACDLERSYGVRRSMLATVATSLSTVLKGPRPADRGARLAITFVPPTVTYLASEATVTNGLVIELGDLFAKVDEYLGVSRTEQRNQAVLPLSPGVVANRGRETRR